MIGDPARANMLFALMDDGWVAAGDLAAVAQVAPSTASEHLAKLTEAGLTTVSAKGKKRYYRLSDPAVAEVLKGVEGLASTLLKLRPDPPRWDEAAVHSRACLDHLSGRLGGSIAGVAMERGYIRQSASGPSLTGSGFEWLASMNIAVEELKTEPRRFLRLCPDWLEDSTHMGGAVGAAMMRGFVAQDWLRRVQGSRKILITPIGVGAFKTHLGLDVRALT